MRIAINGMFWNEPHVGSGQYLHNLVREFATGDSKDKFVLVLPRYTQPVKPRLRAIQTVIMPTPFDRINAHLAKVWFEQVALLQVAHKVRADCLHVPYFGPPRRSRIPVVVSVLDLIPLILPAYRGNRRVQLYMRLAAAGARAARATIAISQWTKKDVMQQLGTPAERIAVTYLAASSTYTPQSSTAITAVLEHFRLTAPYIYYIGGFDQRKNVSLLLDAFAALRQQMQQLPQLVLAGRAAGSDPVLFPDIHRQILELGLAPDVVLLGPVSDQENAALLSGCAAFAFPSLYEGFGLTPLEAMQAGAPVIAAATTSVGEVVASGGLLVEPNDVGAWTTALHQVVTDSAMAADLRRHGQARAQTFKWSQTAAQTLDVYRTMV